MVCFGYTIVNTPHKNIWELNNVPTYCALLGYYEASSDNFWTRREQFSATLWWMPENTYLYTT